MDIGTLAVLTPTAISAAAYLTLRAAFAWRLARARVPSCVCLGAPRVSILKPLAGADDDLVANLASFAEIEYPNLEILLGVSSAADPAYAVARAFVEAFPRIDARVVLTGSVQALNPKVAQLIGLEKHAHGDVLVISDSNVRVRRDYVQSLVAALYEPHVGLVSSLVVGTGERSTGAALENLQLTSYVAPTVLGIDVLGRAISVGKSMAMWRSRLKLAGGFESVASVLGEDHVLGVRFETAGFYVRVLAANVENRNVDCSIARTLERHTRWAKLRRSIDPVAFALEPMLSPALVALCVLALWPCAATAVAWAGATAMQMIGAALAMRALRREPLRWKWMPLEVLRIHAVAACWLLALTSRRVEWRGHWFELRAGSEIVPATASMWARLGAVVANLKTKGMPGARGSLGLGRGLAT